MKLVQLLILKLVTLLRNYLKQDQGNILEVLSGKCIINKDIKYHLQFKM
jgi:hypothetical protein